jgi:ankyrin repeat protein
LLEHGADPNRLTRWGKTPLHNAALSDNCIEIFEALLEHGANPAVKGTHPEVHRSAAGQSPFALAARRGRGDVLALCEQHGVPVRLEGIDELLAACARHDEAQAKSLVARTPSWHAMLLAHGGQFLADFAGNGNTEGVRILLELGIPVDARFAAGNPYFDIARQSTALHVASWRARHETVRFLLARRADVNATDGQGRTPLALAMKACVDSYWAHRRSPESVQALLAAGASRKGVAFPSGYAEVDALLRAQGAAA